jgi:hypothetical protein
MKGQPMNSVSWLIYAGQASGNIQSFCNAVGGFGLIGSVLYSIVPRAFWTFTDGEAFSAYGDKKIFEGVDNKDNKASRAYTGPRLQKGMITICLSLLFVAGLIPSKNTIYAIAASELTGTVAASERGSEALKAIDLWIKDQIKDLAPKESK